MSDHPFSEYTGGYIADLLLEHVHVPNHLYAADLYHWFHSRVFGFKMDRSKTVQIDLFDAPSGGRPGDTGSEEDGMQFALHRKGMLMDEMGLTC